MSGLGRGTEGDLIALPAPAETGSCTVEAALAARRSVRDFAQQALSLNVVSQLLWAAQGITSADGGRPAPSAGGLYPLEIDLVSANVTGLAAGVYRYCAADHALSQRQAVEQRDRLRQAALQQHAIAEAPAIIAIVAVPARSAGKYAVRADRYIAMEVGHVAQSIALQGVALGIGSVVVGAFDDDTVKQVLGLGRGESALALLPVGHPR